MDKALLSQIESVLGLDRRQQPSAQLVDAACWAIPISLADIEGDPYLPRCGTTHVIASHALEHNMRSEILSSQAIRWGIYRLVELGYLAAEIAALKVPSSDTTTFNDELSIQDAGSNDQIDVSSTVNAYHVPDSIQAGHALNADSSSGAKGSTEIRYVVVWPTERLLLWSNDLRGAFIEHAAEDVGFITWPLGRQMMRGKSWELLSCLWGRRDVTLDKISNAVWGRGSTKRSTISSQVTRLNDELARHNLNIVWRVSTTCVHLIGRHIN